MANLPTFIYVLMIAFFRSIVFIRCGTFITNGARSRSRFSFWKLYEAFNAGQVPYVYILNRKSFSVDVICCHQHKRPDPSHAPM
jgi:hypothetical protein